MPQTPLQKKKLQRLLVLALLGVVFVTAGVLWWGFFRTAPAPDTGVLAPPRRVEVDTSILSHPILQELEEPREKVQIPTDIGRDNPFLPAP